MNEKELAFTIQKKLQELSDPVVKQKVERLTSGAKCVGVTVPNLRALAKSLKTENKIIVSQAIELFNFIAPSMCREEVLVAIFVLATMPKKQLCFDWGYIDNWLNYIDNWETCDQLSSCVAVPLIRSNKENIKKLLPYTKSKNLWIRRFAAATAANSNHGGFCYAEETLEICNALKEEKEVMVKKAITWALHEVEKANKKLL